MKNKVLGISIGSVLILLGILNINFNAPGNMKNELLLSNLEAVACTMLEGDVSTGKGTWCNCKDESVVCGTKDFPSSTIYGIKEERL